MKTIFNTPELNPENVEAGLVVHSLILAIINPLNRPLLKSFNALELIGLMSCVHLFLGIAQVAILESRSAGAEAFEADGLRAFQVIHEILNHE